MKRFLLLVGLITITSSVNFTSNATVIVPSTENAPTTEPDPTKVKTALEEFKSLSRKEKKERLKEVRKQWKAFKQAKRNGDDPSTNTLLLVILAILLPPLAVYLHQGEINTKFWISLILTLLFWLPGVIYALIVVLGADKDL